MIILLTRHAKERMAEKGISVGMIKEAISKGAAVRQTEGYLATYTYFAVAYRIIKQGVYKVKTVMVK
ncbi:DUF4258 domain-containing protein [Candidatus Woesearchaeota archaeon]|nr:DUF4258 domain-containing protein [Candidatus Woesearchaeota archaeon]